jgi:hypothetical protein
MGSFDDIPSNMNAHGSVDSQEKFQYKNTTSNMPKEVKNTFNRKKQMTFGNINTDLKSPKSNWDNSFQDAPLNTFNKNGNTYKLQKNNTFFNPDYQIPEKKKERYLEDKKQQEKSPGVSGDENDKTFDISNIPLVASLSENSLMAKPSHKEEKEPKKENDFFLDRFETLKHRQKIDKKKKNSKKNIQKDGKKNEKNSIKNELVNKFQKREVVEDIIYTKHSSDKNIFAAKKRAKGMAIRESAIDKSNLSSPKASMFILNEFGDFNLGDSVCDNAIFVSNKYDFMAIGGRRTGKLKLFSFENKNFQLDCELKIFKSEPTDILFYGKDLDNLKRRI